MTNPITPARARLAAVFHILAAQHGIIYSWCGHCLLWNQPSGCLCGRQSTALLVEL